MNIETIYLGLNKNNENCYYAPTLTNEVKNLFKGKKFVVIEPDDKNEQDMVFYSSDGEELFRMNLCYID